MLTRMRLWWQVACTGRFCVVAMTTVVKDVASLETALLLMLLSGWTWPALDRRRPTTVTLGWTLVMMMMMTKNWTLARCRDCALRSLSTDRVSDGDRGVTDLRPSSLGPHRTTADDDAVARGRRTARRSNWIRFSAPCHHSSWPLPAAAPQTDPEPKIIENSYCTPSVLQSPVFPFLSSLLFLPLSFPLIPLIPPSRSFYNGFPLPSPPHLFSHIPFLFLEVAPSIQLGGFGECCELPQRGLEYNVNWNLSRE